MASPEITKPGGWRLVSWACDCAGYDDETDELGDICSICGRDYGNECECPGPTHDGYEYELFSDVLYARKIIGEGSED